MDFIGPLPEDEGSDCILTITDRLGSDIQIIPTRTDIMAEELAIVFIDNWYCENGLPLEIILDRDKLFVAKFWRSLHKLSGVKLKMSSTNHPETDGSSEHTNKSVNQCLRFHVERNQKGWKRALPRIWFFLMNTVNKSTGYSPFQLKYGHSPRILPHFESTVPADKEDVDAMEIVERIQKNVADAKDNLMLAKISQAYFANGKRSPEIMYKVGDKVMLSTSNRRQEFKEKPGDGRVTKFMPRFDGPWEILEAHPETSTYKLNLPHTTNIFPTFHSSQIKLFIPNDNEIFPSRKNAEIPEPVLVDGELENYVDRILDFKRINKKPSYLVRWVGFGPEHDEWLPASMLEDNEALDRWIDFGGTLHFSSKPT